MQSGDESVRLLFLLESFFSECSIGTAGPCQVSVVVAGFSQTGLQDLHESCKASHLFLGALLFLYMKDSYLFLQHTLPTKGNNTITFSVTRFALPL